MKIATVHKDYGDAIRKRIADDALPIEIRPSLCSATCSEDCEHKNCIEIWTWIPERVNEFDKIIGDIVMSQCPALVRKRELDNTDWLPFVYSPVLISSIRRVIPEIIAREILEATEIEKSWCAEAS